MWKLLKEAEEPSVLIIPTGLHGKKAGEIMNAVIGQLSDGMWENSPIAEHYWPYADIELRGNDVLIRIQTCYAERGYESNYFKEKLNLDEKKIKEFFATKIKAVAKEELKDNKMPEGWDRTNLEETSYLSYDETISFADVYFVYEVLKGRSNANRYPEDVLRDMQ